MFLIWSHTFVNDGLTGQASLWGANYCNYFSTVKICCMPCHEIQPPSKSCWKQNKEESRNWKKKMQGHHYPKSKVGPWISLERKTLPSSSYLIVSGIIELEDSGWTVEELNHVHKRRQKEIKLLPGKARPGGLRETGETGLYRVHPAGGSQQDGFFQG